MVQNKRLIFKQVPDGMPQAGIDLEVEVAQFDLNEVAPPGGITTKVHYASFDPYMRGRMRPAHIESYHTPFQLNEPMRAYCISTVLKSDTLRFKSGDLIVGTNGIEEYSRQSAAVFNGSRSQKIDNPYGLDVRHFLGALGMPGLTAFSSFYDIGRPERGDTIFISSAGGAVGTLVGQLAKREGLKVIGSVGSQAKLDMIKEFGFDDGFNYHIQSAAEALDRLAPAGIDIYYDNVGGEQLDAALEKMKMFGRIVISGMVSQYSKSPAERYGVKNLMSFVGNRLSMRGFVVSDENMGPKYTQDHQEKVQRWLHDGSFKAILHVTENIDQAPEGFVGMLKGENYGKAILYISDVE